MRWHMWWRRRACGVALVVDLDCQMIAAMIGTLHLAVTWGAGPEYDGWLEETYGEGEL